MAAKVLSWDLFVFSLIVLKYVMVSVSKVGFLGDELRD